MKITPLILLRYLQREYKYNNSWLSVTLIQLGNQYLAKEEYETAFEFHQQAVNRYFSQHLQATVMGQIACQYVTKAQYGRGINLYQQSLTIYQHLGNREEEAKTLISLGNVYLNQQEYQQAFEVHQQAIEIYQELGDLQQEIISNYKVLHELGDDHPEKAQSQQEFAFHQ